MRDWLEDVLGLVALVLVFAAGFWVAYGAGLPTGGAELLGAP